MAVTASADLATTSTPAPASASKLVSPPALPPLAMAGLLALLLLYALFGQGARDLWRPDEGRYTCVALNMLDSGDWLVPRLRDDRPHFAKPPLTYWAIAASFAVFGRHEWAARLPGALAFAGTVMLLLALGRRLSPRRPRLAALIFATSPFVYLAANVVTTDTLLVFWETLAMVGFVEWRRREDAANRGLWLLVVWAAYGMAFLTKGPPGLLPLLPMVAVAWTQRGWRGAAAVFRPTGLALFAAIGLTWYVVMVALDSSLLSYFVGVEVVGRVLSDEHRRHPEWYAVFTVYAPVLLLGGLPWNLALLRKMRGADGACKMAPKPTNGLAPERILASPELAGRSDRLLLAVWFWAPLAVLCLARSRMPLYVLPLFAPLSLILARRLEGIALWRGHWRWAIAGWIALLAVTRIGGGMITSDKSSRLFADEIRRQLGAAPPGVVFVNADADFGLRFYLNAAVARVNTKPGRGESTLAEEIARQTPNQLYVVRRKEEGDLLRARLPNGSAWTRLGAYGDWLFYAINQN